MLFSCQECSKEDLVVMRPGGTRVPIPNTRVKAWAADGTALETGWESRRLPDHKKENKEKIKRSRRRERVRDT